MISIRKILNFVLQYKVFGSKSVKILRSTDLSMNSDKNLFELGQKIRGFRLRSGLSQSQLELAINASSGSISRIENGQVNPTKETLLKISKALGCKSEELFNFFEIQSHANYKLIELAKLINSTLDIEDLLQKSVDIIIQNSDLIVASIFVTEGNTIRAIAMTKDWYTNQILKILGMPFRSMQIGVDHPENLIAKTIAKKQAQYDERIFNFGVGVINETVAVMIEKVLNFKCALCLPMIYQGECLGALFFAKNYKDSFQLDKDILQNYCDLVGIALHNAREYHTLKSQLHGQ